MRATGLVVEKISSVNMTELERNKMIMDYVIHNEQALDAVIAILENSNVLVHNHRVMLERLRQSLSCGFGTKNVITSIVEMGKNSPEFLALFVALAIYKASVGGSDGN